MRLLRAENNPCYITYREGTRKVDGIWQTCLHLTVHDNNISYVNTKNAIAKATISFQELLDYSIHELNFKNQNKLDATLIHNNAIELFKTELKKQLQFKNDEPAYQHNGEDFYVGICSAESIVDEIADKLMKEVF